MGGILALVIILVAMVFTDIDTGRVALRFSTRDVFLLLFLSFLLARGLAIVKAASGGSRNVPPEMADWTETRNIVWVGAVGAVVSGALLFLSFSLWEWREVVFLHNAELLATGTALFGFLFKWYILYRVGMHPFGR
jgi:hypothetical protein